MEWSLQITHLEKENDLKQTSNYEDMFQPLIFRG